ncbi:MAG: LysR substrate-binding domain-containing protein [Nitrospinota bacterium]|nr:LysR substrate-binding domain-containing protein [Nitrospinota bacterium]
MLDQVTFHQLELFLLAAKLKNFSKSAERMAISQPAFSAQIIKLESILGASLFERIGRKVELTDSGAMFAEYAQKIMSSLREGKQALDDMSRTVMGTLRIGASTTIANYILPDYLGRFRKSFPECLIEMTVNNTEQIERAILSNEIDLGLVEGPLQHPGKVNSNLFMKDELVVVFSASHRFRGRPQISLDDFRGEPLIIREKGSGTRKVFMGAMDVNHDPLKVVMELGDTEAIKRMLESDSGVAVISLSAVHREIKTKSLAMARIMGCPMPRLFNMILLKNKYISNPVREFISILDPVEKPSLE